MQTYEMGAAMAEDAAAMRAMETTAEVEGIMIKLVGLLRVN